MTSWFVKDFLVLRQNYLSKTNYFVQNNRAEPNHWNIQTISEELKLRESDVENFLTHFDLIDEQAKMVSNTYENDPFTIAEESWDEGRRLGDK